MAASIWRRRKKRNYKIHTLENFRKLPKCSNPSQGQWVFNRSLHDKSMRWIHLKNNNLAAAWNNSTPILAAGLKRGLGQNVWEIRPSKKKEDKGGPERLKQEGSLSTRPWQCHARCGNYAERPYREAHKASVEMDDKQKSAAIKSRRRGGSCKDRGPETIIRL